MKQDIHLSPFKVRQTLASGRIAYHPTRAARVGVPAWAVFLVALSLSPGQAQQQSAAAPSPDRSHGAVTAASSTPSDAKVESDLRYRIGPGDILDIKIFN